jgi:hypothetical protein
MLGGDLAQDGGTAKWVPQCLHYGCPAYGGMAIAVWTPPEKDSQSAYFAHELIPLKHEIRGTQRNVVLSGTTGEVDRRWDV